MAEGEGGGEGTGGAPRRAEQQSEYADRHAEALGHDRPRWRSRMYGRCRYHDRNRLAWLFADKHGREILRRLREIKRQQRRESRS
jgi:hypothetical protein